YNAGINSLTLNNTSAEHKEYEESLEQTEGDAAAANEDNDATTVVGGALNIGIIGDASDYANSPFAYMKELTTVKFPARLSLIGKYAFYNCQKLTTVNFADNCQVTIIDNGAFQNCAALTSIALPDAVTAIGDDAFNGDQKLATFTVNKNSSNLLTIGASALRQTKITTFTIPAKLTGVGLNAFAGCTRLTEVEIPSGLATLNGVFGGCARLNTITVYATESTKLENDDGVVFTANDDGTKTLAYYPMGKRPAKGEQGEEGYEEGTYVVPSNVTVIAANAFAYNPYIKKIVIHNGVTSIGEKAFYMCGSLEQVVFDEDSEATAQTQLAIGNYAFAGCAELGAVGFPKRLTTLG
ncbi:MAG: leucine-rich repeat domain-containing protein, partial [Clostridiales bacterium]|nr:leucine-rich repeat domain-containing protein [Clostridiales bacterium]